MSHESESAKRAPADLALVQRFVNTVELDEGPEDDELTDPDTLVAWFAERGLCKPGARATQAELERAIVVREGLRAVLDGHNGGEPDPDAVAALEAATDHASLRASFTGERPELTPVCGGIDAGLARLLAAVTTAAADGSWQRLKACADEECRWAFYDHSRNRSGRWCSMATCGNQQKARTYRERARADG